MCEESLEREASAATAGYHVCWPDGEKKPQREWTWPFGVGSGCVLFSLPSLESSFVNVES